MYFLIVCVQSRSPFMIIECVVFFNARKRFFHKNATVLTVIIKIKFFIKMESPAELALNFEIVLYQVLDLQTETL